MQIAGEKCKLCAASILLASEATWCSRCTTVFHKSCLQNADLICPACFQRYDAPEDNFAYSKSCPICRHPNDPPKTNCSHCGERTFWDTGTDYEDYLKHLKGVSKVRALRGFAEIGFGFVCVGVLIAAFASHESIPFIPIKIAVVGGLIALTDGINQLIKSRRLREFR